MFLKQQVWDIMLRSSWFKICNLIFFRLSKRRSHSNYGESQGNSKLKKALSLLQRGQYRREASKISKVPKSTIMNNWRQYQESNKDIDSFLETRSGRLVIMTDTEEKSVQQYCLWQNERGMNLDNHVVKAIIHDIHAKVVEQGEKRQQINMTDGSSKKIYERTLF